MLVLRRRPGEAILFDGGLRVTLLELASQRAWLGLSGPGVAGEVACSILSSSPGRAELGVRRPARVTERKGVIEVEVDHEAGGDCTLVVARRPGEALTLAGLRLVLAEAHEDRAVISLQAGCLPAPVSLSVFSASGAEAKIGIDAPREVQVFREEVWRAVAAENSAAAGSWSPAELEGLPAVGEPQAAPAAGEEGPRAAAATEQRAEAVPGSRGTATP